MSRHGRRLLRPLWGALARADRCFAGFRPQTAPAKPAPPAAASGLGRITGKVTERGKDPVSFANVVVLGTHQGTLTDENGNFVIPGVTVGTVQVQAQAVGYDRQIQTVQVNAGATSTVNFNFGEQKVVKEMQEIEVRAEKRIDTKSSSTKQTITAEKLKEIPVDNLRDAVSTKPVSLPRAVNSHSAVARRRGEVPVRRGRGPRPAPRTQREHRESRGRGHRRDLRWLRCGIRQCAVGCRSVSTKEGTDRFGGEVRWDTDRYGDPTKTSTTTIASRSGSADRRRSRT
jgi:hypothetical protein